MVSINRNGTKEVENEALCQNSGNILLRKMMSLVLLYQFRTFLFLYHEADNRLL